MSLTVTVGAFVLFWTVIVSEPLAGRDEGATYTTAMFPLESAMNGCGVLISGVAPTIALPPPAVGVNDREAVPPGIGLPPVLTVTVTATIASAASELVEAIGVGDIVIADGNVLNPESRSPPRNC